MKVGAVHPGTHFFPAAFQEGSVSLSEIRTWIHEAALLPHCAHEF